MSDLKLREPELFTPEELTLALTGSLSWADLVAAGIEGYQPSFCGAQARRQERRRLANFFDEAMEKAGSPSRSYRCHWEPRDNN